MNLAAFVLLSALLAGYVLLDGYDLGVGVLHLFVARTDRERAASFATIGPFWSGNEVVLITAAAALFALFPQAYAAWFSAFYLPFVFVLWLLMVRGMSIELRSHFSNSMWRGFWDVGFAGSSTLLALLFGVTIGNLVRGVPFNSQGYFVGTFSFLLNPYAIGVGVLSVVTLALHGCAFMLWRLGREDEGELVTRVRRALRFLWPIALVLYGGITAATFFVHPVHAAPLWPVPAIGLAALITARFSRAPAIVLTGTSAWILALIASAAATIGPGGLDVTHEAAGGSLPSAVIAIAVGLGAVLLYATLAARKLLRA